jgi:hypothetical protein
MHFIFTRNEDGTVVYNKNAGSNGNQTNIYKTTKSNEEIAAEVGEVINNFKTKIASSSPFIRFVRAFIHGTKLDKEIEKIFDEDITEY